MFDVKLLDIFQTASVGVFTLMLVLYFYFIFNKFFIKDKFNEDEFSKWVTEKLLNKQFNDTGYLLLVLVLVYFFGIVAGDLTERMTDGNNPKERNRALVQLNKIAGMPNVIAVRKMSLIDSDDSLTTLGKSVFLSHKLVIEANTFNRTEFFTSKDSAGNLLPLDEKVSLNKLSTQYLKDDRTFHAQHKEEDVTSKFENFISLLYYTSKNWCYSKDHEPLNELKSIQMRVDLTRSVVLLTTTASILLLAVYLLFLSLNIRNFTRAKFSSDFKAYFKSVNLVVLNSLLLFFVVTYLCKECFKICLLSYNKRAFGYYVTHLANRDEIPDGTLYIRKMDK